jgi:hypothetical protein
LLIVAAGCSRSELQIAPVRGSVTLDGKPVFEAKLVFQPEGPGSPSYGFTDQNGRYELGYKRGVKGARLGWHSVSIVMDTEIVGPDGNPVHRPQLVPARYNEKTELRGEVKRGDDNEFNFALESAPGRSRR